MTVTSLTHGARACWDCLRRGLERPNPVDDGLCDACGHPAEWFTELVMTFGGDLVASNVCSECVRFSRRVVTDAAA